MYDQPDRNETAAPRGYNEEAVEKVARAPLREQLDRAVARLSKEFDMLTERLQPLLAPDVPHDSAATMHDLYQSSLGNQVSALHDLATRIATVNGRIEF